MPFYMHPTALCDKHFDLVERVNRGEIPESYLRAWRDGVTATYRGGISCIAGYLISDADQRKMAQEGCEEADMCGGVLMPALADTEVGSDE